jgi:hypothetical protein
MTPISVPRVEPGADPDVLLIAIVSVVRRTLGGFNAVVDFCCSKLSPISVTQEQQDYN